ncbi:FtsQ-type POTRA domain-containing protein [Caldicoprobacter algeriensis]|uniref:cell division protein FtsQ/DivIB n=1 Tax=Caldicoprobacter algeriensis TaxID=699281 RepID=UPI00207A24DA|nr:FtsQ-type POTRA domain-containing protein [Caldicoprobacter algeriensis]MCM8899863.1 FtsQ-type POTRA domain-containing protein [Caldicoprobacter algeriensis]
MGNGRRKGLFLLLFLLTVLVAMVYIGTEVFQVKKVTVTGNQNIKDDDIIRIAGIPIGQNIFKIDRKQIRERIESNPLLKVLSINFKYPDEVIINVKERKPVAAIPYLGSYVVVDIEGYVMEIYDNLEDMPYPLVQGLGLRGCTVGKPLSVADSYQMKALSRVLDEVYKQQLEEDISEIIMDNPNDIYIVSRNGTVVRLGQAIEVDKKLKWLKTPNFRQIDSTGAKGMLDVSIANQAIFKPLEEEVD